MANENESAVRDQQPVSKPVEAELTPEERKHRAFQRLIALKGKVHLDIDLDDLRGRSRIEARASDAHDGDMAKVTEGREKKVWPPRTMDDLTPEDRAQQMRFAEKLKALAGKVKLNIDLDELRGRPRVSGSDPESQRIEATRQAVYDGGMANRNEAAVEDHEPVTKPADEELTPEERKHRAFQRAIALKGKFRLDIDIDELRGRHR
jgi:hypothetical protein